MASNYVFSLQPTFTQGLILGQLSILILLGLILKYLFLENAEQPLSASSYQPRIESDFGLKSRTTVSVGHFDFDSEKRDHESAEWLNLLLHQIIDVYRHKLRHHLTGPEGEEAARKCVEEYANRIRPTGFLDDIKVSSISLGSAAPRLHNGRRSSQNPTDTIFDVEYNDSVSVSLSTSYLFNYPKPLFARLPLSLTISLSVFKASVTISPPSPSSPSPILVLSVSPDFTLELATTSLMGSRAKLADVPKLHELIQHQVRRVLASKAEWTFSLPHLSVVKDSKDESKTRMTEEIIVGGIQSDAY